MCKSDFGTASLSGRTMLTRKDASLKLGWQKMKAAVRSSDCKKCVNTTVLVVTYVVQRQISGSAL